MAGLSRIERAEGLTQAQLAEDLDLEPIAVGRVIDRLERPALSNVAPTPTTAAAGGCTWRRSRPKS